MWSVGYLTLLPRSVRRRGYVGPKIVISWLWRCTICTNFPACSFNRSTARKISLNTKKPKSVFQTRPYFEAGYTFLLPWRNSPTRARTASLLRFIDHEQRLTTVGRTPVARRRDLYLTAQSQETDIHVAVGIRTRNLSKRSALYRQATGIGWVYVCRAFYVNWVAEVWMLLEK